MIPYGRQEITQADIDAVVEVLKSDFLTQGPSVPLFEKSVAKYCGADYGVAVNSATSALHIACLALGLSKGDWLWTSPITFVASANCALYCAANVGFIDIDPKTYNISIEALKEKLICAEKTDCLPRIVVVVHLCGQSCEMMEIYKLSQEYGFKIIEDASHAIGGKYRGKPVGQGQYSDVTIFSFHPVKIVTTGEGGIAITNDQELSGRMKLLREHGITRDEKKLLGESGGSWYYEQIDLGFNYRMTDIQAALGVSQLQRLDEYVNGRNMLAKRYDGMLMNFPVTTPWQHPDSYSSRHLYVIRLRLDSVKSSRNRVISEMRNQGVGVNVHYIPVYRQPYYQAMGCDPEDYPNAEQYYREAISLPLYPGLLESDQEKVVSALHQSI